MVKGENYIKIQHSSQHFIKVQPLLHCRLYKIIKENGKWKGRLLHQSYSSHGAQKTVHFKQIYYVYILYTRLLPSATTRPRVAVPGETNLSTQVTTDTAVAQRIGTLPVA